MTLWAIVPVKPLRRGKSRLADILSQDERTDLNRHLLENTLNTLNSLPEIGRKDRGSRYQGAGGIMKNRGHEPRFFIQCARCFLVSVPDLFPFADIAHHTIDQFGRIEFGDRRALYRAHFHEVEADHGLVSADRPEQFERVAPHESARLGGSGGRHYRGIEAVRVYGDVDRVGEASQDLLFQSGNVRIFMHQIGLNPAGVSVMPFVVGYAAYADLHGNGGAGGRVQGAGVAVGGALVFFSQVGVSVEMQYR